MSEGGEKKHKILKGVLYTAAVLALIACCAAGILYLAVRKSVGQKIEIPEGFEEEEVTRNVEPAADEGEEGAERAAADEEPAAFHNIALIGIDSRKNEIPKRANTDTIIIASINEKTGDIRLVSIYRDTLLDIGSTNSEDKDQFIFDKANSAYANGGMWQLVRMLEKNLDIVIDDYAIVNFLSVAKIVDAVGGISVWMTKQEVIHMNNYCVETSSVTGMDYEPIEPEEEAQHYHLNGVQAVSYARIRYTAGNDMKRTQRQRVVIEKVMAKAKLRSFSVLESIISDVLPSCKTSMSLMELLDMASNMKFYRIDKTTGFPEYYLGHRTLSHGKWLDPQIPVTLKICVKDLHLFLFDDRLYVPSKDVLRRSRAIVKLTGIGEERLEEAKNHSVIRNSGGEADVVR